MKKRVFLRKLIANKTALSGLIIIVVWVAVTISAPVLAPYDPLYLDVSQRLQEPGPGHPFGTDELGRDIYSRVLYGSRISLPASFLVTLIASLIGGSVGAIAGFFGGWFDNLVMRIADVALAFPAIVLAMAITVVLEPGLGAIMIALIVIWWPRYARIVRGQVIAVRENMYVLASRSIGTRGGRILLRHVLPNSYEPLLVQFTTDLGTVILLIAGLGFLGLGIRPPAPEWGTMVSLAQYRFSFWWLGAFPGLAIFTAVMGFSLFGDGLRDILDPRVPGRTVRGM